METRKQYPITYELWWESYGEENIKKLKSELQSWSFPSKLLLIKGDYYDYLDFFSVRRKYRLVYVFDNSSSRLSSTQIQRLGNSLSGQFDKKLGVFLFCISNNWEKKSKM